MDKFGKLSLQDLLGLEHIGTYWKQSFNWAGEAQHILHCKAVGKVSESDGDVISFLQSRYKADELLEAQSGPDTATNGLWAF